MEAKADNGSSSSSSTRNTNDNNNDARFKLVDAGTGGSSDPGAVMDSNSLAKSSTSSNSNRGSGASNGSLPPVPHATKPQTRVFSKKANKGGEPVPIPGARNKGGAGHWGRPRDGSGSEQNALEGWEMSPRGNADADGRWGLGSPLSSSSPPWSFPRGYDNGTSMQEDEDQPATGYPYLTPIDSPPPVYQGSQFSYPESPTGIPVSPTGEFTNASFNSARSRDRGDTWTGRFDSGVGDSESEHGPRRGRTISGATSSSASSSYPRLSKLSTHPEQHYEDIDAYRKYVQPDGRSPTAASRPVDASLPNGLNRLPRVNITGITNSDSEDSVTVTTVVEQNSGLRPEPDRRTASLPHTYSPLEMNGYVADCKTDGSKTAPYFPARRYCCCLVIFLMLIFFISTAALSLSIYLLLDDGNTESTRTGASVSPSTGSGANSSISDLQRIVEDLQNDVKFLLRENQVLKAEMQKMQSSIEDEVQPLYKELAFLTAQQRDTDRSVTMLDTRLTSEIANISLTPGPQGAAGVANFSLCVSQSRSQSASASDRHPTQTQYLPSDKQLPDYFGMFAFCSQKGAAKVQLERTSAVDPNSSSSQYRCVCTGRVTGESRTVCTLHAVLCPTLHKS